VPEPGQQDAATWRISGWSLRTKVAVVLVVPTVVALVLGGLRLQEQLDNATGLGTVRDQLDVVGETVRLADLMALEMVAAVPPDPDARPEREDAVDQQVTVVRNAADFTQLSPDLSRKLGDALGELVDARRQAATNRTDPVTEAFGYRNVISDLAELAPRIVSFAHAEDLDDQARIVQSMVLLRGALASQEALISAGHGGAVSSDVAASVQHSSAEEAVLEQQLSLDIPAVDLPEFVSATHTWSARRDAIQKAIARDRTADLTALLPDLQREQTDLRGLVENRFNDLADTVSIQTNQARSDALRDTAIVLGALLAALAIALTVARSLLLPVRRLRAAALSAAHESLPETVARVRSGERVDWRSVEPMAVHTDEEIGQLARAFDDMHQQAVRLAGEQAELRHQVSEMFMTLSRRSQSLVELQLGVIEGLEADERDPRRLDGLFRLDHLATRLRRNGENLQVLAGGTPPKRGNRPVSVVEVLRAATSEVKDYRRVSLGHAPNASVRASAATDVVHILAELLENATRFSPPERKVVLTADRGTDGGLLFEVIDAGLGMAPDDLESANRRLAAADAVGPETTRRMGLFVVSLLAARHEVTVRLRRTYERANQAGITASVHVPGALVISESAANTAPDGTSDPSAEAALDSGPRTGPIPRPYAVPAIPEVPGIPAIPASNGSRVGWFTPAVPVPDNDRIADATTDLSDEDAPADPSADTANSPNSTDTADDAAERAATNGTDATDTEPVDGIDPPTIRVTAAGLPVRTPGGGRVPSARTPTPTPTGPTGAAGPGGTSPGFRDPDAVRSNLSRHYSGVRAARQAQEEREEQESTPERKN
jgi:signal transduction histidine kinase